MFRLFFLISLFFSNSLYAQSFEPGVWKSNESLELNGLALPASKHEKCVTAAQAKDAKATIEKELKKQGCSLNKWTVKDKKLEAALDCKNDNFEASGTLQGAFASKSYDLTGEAKGTIRQTLPAMAVIKLSGQWLKKCPK